MRVFLFIDDRTYKRYKDADIRDHHNHPIEVGLNIRPILDQNVCIGTALHLVWRTYTKTTPDNPLSLCTKLHLTRTM
ncbi:hypothetical protein Anas_13635 [Armadillidium nasatum]|uniref:Uncharacterized protein n=1 Tax=Armadillidium nasatum TaxID=96803 RepID=A0A5N5T8N8_9CRUS|nr:hypothetical protein Anas_13635 [Armadillidium nasatum]